MKTFLLTIMLFVAYNAISQNGTKNFIDQNYIEVTGKSELDIIPDKITMKVMLSERDTKKQISLEQMENQMMTTLAAIGIDTRKDVTVKDQASIFRTKLLSKDILLSKEFNIVVNSASKAQMVFEELEKANISNISIVKLENSNIEQYRKDVKVNAVKAAKEKAELLSQAIGQNTGRAIYIEEISNQYLTNSMASNKLGEVNIKASGVSLKNDISYNFDNIKIEAAVLCRFDLK